MNDLCLFWCDGRPATHWVTYTAYLPFPGVITTRLPLPGATHLVRHGMCSHCLEELPEHVSPARVVQVKRIEDGPV